MSTPAKIENDGHRAFEKLEPLPCWRCPSPAVWHVTEHEWGDTLLACEEHKYLAFS